MLTSMLLMAVLSAPQDAEWIGTATSIITPTTITRDQRSYRAVEGSGLLMGDSLQTAADETRADGAGAAFFLSSGVVLQLAHPSRVSIHATGPALVIEVHAGEMRAVVGRELSMEIRTGWGAANVRGGIVRVSVEQARSVFQMDNGNAELTSSQGENWALREGRQATAVAGQAIVDSRADAGGKQWQLHADAFRLAAVRSAGDRHRGRWRLARRTTGGGRPDTIEDANGIVDTSRSSFSNVLSSLNLGASSSASFLGASGGLNSDAGNGIAPGSLRFVHLVSAETNYTLDDVTLAAGDAFPVTREYWSIGLGPAPTTQVQDQPTAVNPIFRTDPVPTTIVIPGRDAYLLRMDEIIGDPVLSDVTIDLASASSLKGDPPRHPVVEGAVPFVDVRAEVNDRMTFGLGEFALQRTVDDHPEIAVRRSDQDRRVVPNPFLPGFDLEEFNSQVTFMPGLNSQGRPDLLPVDFGPAPTVRQLGTLRRAALTTLMADRLHEHARRTGQTRFVIDGTVIDISGYRGQ